MTYFKSWTTYYRQIGTAEFCGTTHSVCQVVDGYGRGSVAAVHPHGFIAEGKRVVAP